MLPVTFTPQTTANAPALSEITLCAYRDHYLHLWHDAGEWYMNHSFAVDQLTTELADPNARYFMVNLNGEPVGFLKLNLDKVLPDTDSITHSEANDMELERIYLVKEATGHGVGQAAMRFVEDMARERGKKTLWLKSMDTGPALGFYERMGFKHHGTQRLNFPQMKEEFRGMIVLVKGIFLDGKQDYRVLTDVGLGLISSILSPISANAELVLKTDAQLYLGGITTLPVVSI